MCLWLLYERGRGVNMEYQNLVNLCKQAYSKKDLSSAYKYWEMIYEVLDKKLNSIDINNEEERFKCYKEYNDYMKQFTDKEVYDITDYGKAKAYRQMEVERTHNILNESIKLYDLTKDEKMKSLDNFLDLYEYCILKSKTNNGKYEIYDLQLDSVLDNEDKTLKETIKRVVDMAVDNEVNNREFITDEEGIEYVNSDYVQDLLKIQKEYEKKEVC